MPRKVRIVLSVMIAVVLCALWLRWPTLHAHSMEAEITAFVLEHQDALSTIASGQVNGSNHDESYQDVKIDGLCPGKHPIVQFYYSGTGLAPSAHYYGFYYSPDGTPASYYNVDTPLEPAGENAWTWRGEGDNGGVTRQITQQWYSYEAWF